MSQAAVLAGYPRPKRELRVEATIHGWQPEGLRGESLEGTKETKATELKRRKRLKPGGRGLQSVLCLAERSGAERSSVVSSEHRMTERLVRLKNGTGSKITPPSASEGYSFRLAEALESMGSLFSAGFSPTDGKRLAHPHVKGPSA